MFLVLSMLTLLGAVAHADGGALPHIEQSLRAGRYAGAEAALVERIEAGGPSADLLYDLGNAHLLQGEAAEALVAYERGLLLAPRDADLRANHARALDSVGVSRSPTAADRVLSLVSLQEYAWAMSAGAVLAVLGALVAFRRRRTGFLAATAGAAITVLAALALWIGRGAVDDAVVLTEETVTVAPARASAAAGSLSVGQRVHVLDQHGDHLRVRTDSGETGWVPAASVARLAG